MTEKRALICGVTGQDGASHVDPAVRSAMLHYFEPGAPVTRLLHDNITEGTGTAAYTGCAGEAGKTGTTNDFFDAWFVGFTPRLATATWVGYPNAQIEMTTEYHGGTVAGGPFRAEAFGIMFQVL